MRSEPARVLGFFKGILDRVDSLEEFWAIILEDEDDASPERLAEVVDRFRGMVNQALYLTVWGDS